MDTPKKKIGRAAIIATVAASLSTVLVVNELANRQSNPFLRPNGLGVSVQQAKAGSAYVTQGLNVKAAETGGATAPAGMTVAETRTAATGSAAQTRPDVGEVRPVEEGRAASPKSIAGSEVQPTTSGKAAQAQPDVGKVEPVREGEAASPRSVSRSEVKDTEAGGPTEARPRLEAADGARVEVAAAPGDMMKFMRSPGTELSPKKGRTGHEYSPAREMASSGDYTHRLLAMAKAGKWSDLADAARQAGIDASCLTVEDTGHVAEPEAPSALAGTLVPSSQAAELKKQLDDLHYPKYGPPIVIVANLGGDSQKVFDATFAALGDGPRPMVAFAIGKMSAVEMLGIPGFLRKYRGRYAGVIANYDVYALESDYSDDPNSRERRLERISLVLEVVRRGNRATKIWVAEGFYGGWVEWMQAQPAGPFDGVVLCGYAAAASCLQTQSAAFMLERMRKAAPGVSVGVMGVEHPALTAVLSRAGADDESYRTKLVDGLRKLGFAFVHIQREEEHPQ